MNNSATYYTYILKCADNSYYVGHTENPNQRLKTHNSGQGPKWTALRLPVELVYCEISGKLEQAIKRERQLKKWTRAKKEALIAKNITKLKQLSKSL